MEPDYYDIDAYGRDDDHYSDRNGRSEEEVAQDFAQNAHDALLDFMGGND